MPPRPCPLTFQAITKARLVILITDVHGRTLSGTGAAMGRARTWLTRKLGADQAQPKPVLLEDCDAILAFLGEPADRLLQPVLLAGDLELLRRIATADPTLIVDTAAQAYSTRRLLEQGLVVLEGDELLITNTGLRLTSAA